MKKMVVVFYLLNSTLSYCMHNKSSQPIALKDIEHHALMHSRSPGDWPPTEQSILEARQSHALIEHQEAAKRSQATKLLAFLGDQSLQLIEKVKAECRVGMGDPSIDKQLQEMFDEVSATHHDALDNELEMLDEHPDDLNYFVNKNNLLCANTCASLNKKIYLSIIQQALILNQSVRSNK